MENASKALLIAGGILLAILILSALIFMFTSVKDFSSMQEQKALAKQTAKFNAEYDAYNKTVMYGTDVMTVVNKAVNYNQKLDTDEEEYFIDIILVLSNDFYTTETTVTTYANGNRTEETTKTLSEKSLRKGTYNIKAKQGTTKINTNILEFFSQGDNSFKEENKKDKIIQVYRYSALANFKSTLFKCTGVTYSNVTGRINSMTFSIK